MEEKWSQYGKMLTVNLGERYMGVDCSICDFEIIQNSKK